MLKLLPPNLLAEFLFVLGLLLVSKSSIGMNYRSTKPLLNDFGSIIHFKKRQKKHIYLHSVLGNINRYSKSREALALLYPPNKPKLYRLYASSSKNLYSVLHNENIGNMHSNLPISAAQSPNR